MHKIIVAILLTLSFAFVVIAHAQSTTSAESGSNAGSPTATAAAITDYRLTPDKLQKAEALYRTHAAMYVIGTLYGIAVLIAVLACRFSAKFRDIAEHASKRRFVQALIFAPLIFLSIDILSLPLSLYSQHLQLSYGLSVQGWGSWWWDWIKGEMVGAVISTLIIWGLYAILRRSPTRWWFYGWLAAIPVILLLVFVQPMFIDPLFNKFLPLESKQPQLIPELEKVMHRGGLNIPRDSMFEMQASEKLTTYNAYVTGIGASKRVVVWDNTSRDMTIPEILFVFGHEQGHYVLNHIWILLGFLIVGVLLALYIAYRCIAGVLNRRGPRWGIRDVSDWASLPALLLILSVLSIAVQPINAAFSRHMEHQADMYGLEVIHGLVPNSPQVAARAFQKLGEKSLSYPTPNPLYVFWVFDHPPVGDRIRFAAEYQPWVNGAKPTFIE